KTRNLPSGPENLLSKIRLEEVRQLGGEVPVLGCDQNGVPVRRKGVGITVKNAGPEMIVRNLKAELDMLLNHSGAMQGPLPVVTSHIGRSETGIRFIGI